MTRRYPSVRVSRTLSLEVTPREVELEPVVGKFHVRLDEPSLEDQRSDVDRLLVHVREAEPSAFVPLDVLRELPKRLRAASFEVTAILADDEVIEVLAGNSGNGCYGLAFEVGTTTVVGMLVEIRAGRLDEPIGVLVLRLNGHG